MTETQKQKLKQFANDVILSGAVKEVIENEILGRNVNKDVQVLAAERIAIDVLKDAWKELEKYKSDVRGEEPIRQQVGL